MTPSKSMPANMPNSSRTNPFRMVSWSLESRRKTAPMRAGPNNNHMPIRVIVFGGPETACR